MKKKGDVPVAFGLRLFLIFTIIVAGIILIFMKLSFKSYYKATLNNEFIGYYSSYETLKETINSINKEREEDGIKVNLVLENEPSLEREFIKTKYANSFNNIDLIEKTLSKEYIFYTVKVNNEDKFCVATKEEAEKLINEIKEEVKESTEISIEEVKSKDKYVLTSSEDVSSTKRDVIERNFKVTSRSGTLRTTKSKYIWPVAYTTITSNFGPRWGKMHTGIDIGVPLNSPVYAMKNGKVILAGWNGGYGYQVKIQHSDGIITTYAHNNKVLVKVGQYVEQGEQIAISGSTGNSTGPHCHIEFIVNGEFVNPKNYI